VYWVLAASPLMLHITFIPVVLVFPLSLPTFGLVSIVQLNRSAASGSVIFTDTWLVPVPTPVLWLFGVSVSIVRLSFAVKVYHSLVQSVPSLAFTYHV